MWAIAEIALQVYDTYETAQTVLDPCASLAEKGTILGLYVFGLALPGGGYSTAGATGIRSVKRLDQADDLRQTFKLVDRADDTRAATRIGDEVDEIDTIKVVDDLCFHSFSAETLVSTEDGLRPISEIVIGDWVWAYHEGTGAYGLFPVTDVMVHTDPAQVHLLLDGELLETTPEHPFYTLERGWVDAGDLWVGAHIRKADGSYGMVQFIAVEREPQVMYNLTVAEAHTFFVGAQRWLVHNSGCPELPVLIGDRPRKLVPQAVEHLKAFEGSASQKADFLTALYTQISNQSVTLWTFTRYNLVDGSYVFEGPGGFTTVISADGRLWRGNPDDYAFNSATEELIYDRLSEL